MLPLPPTRLADVVFPTPSEKIKIDRILNKSVTFPVYRFKNGILIYGNVGTGKSTFAELLPHLIEATHSTGPAQPDSRKCKSPKNGVTLLEQIELVAMLVPSGTYRYVVLDEVDNLTPDAMKQMKMTMDIRNTVFIMTTNHLTDVDIAVRSRCHLINFNPTGPSVWIPKARETLVLNGISDPVYLTDSYILKEIIRGGNDFREILGEAERVALDLLAKAAALLAQTGSGVI